MKTKFDFPIWKLRKFTSIEESLGRTLITSMYNTYVLDDICLKGSFAKRRMQLTDMYDKENKFTYPVYPLKEKINLLRQMVKYPTGTKFIDINGYIFEYKKSSKLYKIYSKKIISKRKMNNITVFYVDTSNIPYITEVDLTYIPYASIMCTDYGPFLYDFTSEYHVPYRRKM